MQICKEQILNKFEKYQIIIFYSREIAEENFK
jgi:hypothetical protein